MDQPDLPARDHHEALEGLRILNTLSQAARPMLHPILQLAHQFNRDRLRLLDVACGGGDVPLALAHLARRHGLHLELTLLDRSPIALDHAQATAKASGINITAIPGDTLTGPLPEADVITNSLFLHHLDAPDVTNLLRRLGGHTRHLLLISDLRRSQVGLAIAAIHCRLFTRSPIVHHDGPISVRAAWTRPELLQLARSAGLTEANIHNIWPWRMLLEYRKGAAHAQ